MTKTSRAATLYVTLCANILGITDEKKKKSLRFIYNYTLCLTGVSSQNLIVISTVNYQLQTGQPMKYKNTPTPQIANEKFHIFLTSLNDKKKKVGPKLFPMQPLI